jgi:hypothetical protein
LKVKVIVMENFSEYAKTPCVDGGWFYRQSMEL